MSGFSLKQADEMYMQRAIDLAAAQLGQTAPNPAVGCVIVLDNEIIAEAATGVGGHPHAEEKALADLVERNLSGATAYVTLEPCNARSSGAHGCSDRLISSGIGRVVVAQKDPHPTARNGIEKLRTAGVQVDLGVLENKAARLTAGFFHLLEKGYPLVIVGEDNSNSDADFELQNDERIEDALLRLGRLGITRIHLHSKDQLVEELVRREIKLVRE